MFWELFLRHTLCLLFKQCVVTQPSSIFGKYKPNVIRSASQLARILRYNSDSTQSTAN